MSRFSETPEWVRHAIFYQIFPDRFAFHPSFLKPSNLEPWDAAPTPYGFKGGDLYGVIDHLDYLQDLGITAIYFTPVFQSASNHRYHTHDYHQVDPLLGGNLALRQLLDEAHQRGMRIILDGVFNHASRGFFPFNHILETGAQSPYIDWFTVYGYPLNAYEGEPRYKCWWNLPALPSLNTANPQVRAYIYDVARRWIDFGIDGWRLDVPFEIKDPSFWQEFRSIVKTANPDAYITGEIPWNAAPWLQGDQFDGVMNYLMAYAAWGFFGGEDLDADLVGHWREHGPEYFTPTAEGFTRHIQNLLHLYPQAATLSQLNLLDSHDTARFLSLVSGRRDLLRLATLFQMTYPGAPCVYYGNEIGLAGGKDPDCRRAFPWEEKTWDQDLRSFFQDCIRLRQAHPALRSLEMEFLYAKEQVVVYRRAIENDQVIVALNRSAQPFSAEIKLNFTGEITLHNQIGSGEITLRQGKLLGMQLPPHTGAAFA